MRLDSKNFKNFFGLKINFVIKILIVSDIIILSSIGFITPLFAVFITDSINGATIAVVGISEMVYLLFRSLGQIPIGYVLDKISGEKDDYISLLIGSLIYALIPIAYIFIDTAFELYVVQAIYGLAAALAVPSWLAIFTRHIDKNKEGIEWGIYQTLTGLTAAFTAGLGGLIAQSIGFDKLFLLTSFFSLIGVSYLLLARNFINKSKKRKRRSSTK